MAVPRPRNRVRDPRPLVNRNGLVGWWTFDEGSGNDASGKGNVGALQNAPPATGGLIRGNALSFNGSSQYVRVPTAPILDGFTECTFTAWIYITGDTDTNGMAILAKPTTDSAVPTDPFQLYELGIAHTTRQLATLISKGTGGSRVILLSTGTVPLNTATFVASTWDGTTLRQYINGLVDATTAAFAGPVGANSIDLRLGALVSQTINSYFTGPIDDVRIYNRALTPAEINTMYNRAKSAFSLSPDEWEMPALKDNFRSRYYYDMPAGNRLVA